MTPNVVSIGNRLTVRQGLVRVEDTIDVESVELSPRLHWYHGELVVRVIRECPAEANVLAAE